MAKNGRGLTRPNNQAGVYIGKQVRYLREIKGVTQQTLANAIGVSFQQIQKYETGKNRVSVGVLWDIAKFIEIPITEFFPSSNENMPYVNPEIRIASKLLNRLSGQELDVLIKALNIIRK